MLLDPETWLLTLAFLSLTALAWLHSPGTVPAFARVPAADQLALDPASHFKKLRSPIAVFFELAATMAAKMTKAVQSRLGRTKPTAALRKQVKPVLLMPKAQRLPAFAPVAAELPSSSADRTLSTQSQIKRLSQIVTAAIDQAGNAQRLHCAAQEQIAGADYALQNLRNELASIMPAVAALAPRMRVEVRPAAATVRTRRVSAIAA